MARTVEQIEQDMNQKVAKLTETINSYNTGFVKMAETISRLDSAMIEQRYTIARLQEKLGEYEIQARELPELPELSCTQ